MLKQNMKGQEGALQEDLPKTSRCPDAMTLASCLEGKLGKDELARVHLHLDACEDCRNLMNILRESYAHRDQPSDDELGAIERLSAKAKKLITR